MTVQIRLFAVLRERAGRESIELELDEGATVSDVLRTLRERAPFSDLIGRMPVLLAVNRDYATSATPLSADDELALIPPVSGGADVSARVHVRVSEDPLSLDALVRGVSRPAAGAIVMFCGVTREVERLDYEAYREMAEARIEAIVRDCIERHGLEAVAAEHRVGEVTLGEPSVAVAVSAPHRAEAFAAAREAIDRIKAEVPIWKREPAPDGSMRWVGAAPGWPEPNISKPQAGDDRSATAAPAMMSEPRLTHIEGEGRARMVDVGAKEPRERRALARARVRMSPACAAAIQAGDVQKGEVLGTARLAGIQAAKRTAELIPLAHPIELSFVDLEASVDPERGLVELLAEAHAVARTGVEMEAMTACAVGALTVYDMVKGLERGVEIEQIVLLEKTGGRSDWRRTETTRDGSPRSDARVSERSGGRQS